MSRRGAPKRKPPSQSLDEEEDDSLLEEAIRMSKMEFSLIDKRRKKEEEELQEAIVRSLVESSSGHTRNMAATGSSSECTDRCDSTDVTECVLDRDFSDESCEYASEVDSDLDNEHVVSDSDEVSSSTRADERRAKSRSAKCRGSDEAQPSEQLADQMNTIFDSSLKLHLTGQYMKACEAIITPLYPHQMYALAWMMNRENSRNVGVQGGILADDMGLGKSLTCLALIMTNFQEGKPLCNRIPGFVRRPTRSVSKYCPDHNEDLKKTAVKNATKAKAKSTVPTVGFLDMSDNDERSVMDAMGSSNEFDLSDDEFVHMVENHKLIEAYDQPENSLNHGSKEAKNPLSKQQHDEVIATDKDDLSLHNKLNLDGSYGDIEDDDDCQRDHEPCTSSGITVSSKRGAKKGKAKGAQVNSNVSETSKVLTDAGKLGSVNQPDAVPPEQFALTSEQQKNLIIPPKEVGWRVGNRLATLIVTPASLISHWIHQIDIHIHKDVDIRVLVHHGNQKALFPLELEEHEIVITTYGTLMSEMDNNGPLLRAKWLRVILDEGHLIKNHNSKTTKAAHNLNTKRKWIVSGTPLQNNLTELWSLLNWLNEPRYGNNKPYFRQHIIEPVKRGLPRGIERLQILLHTICLRRTKTDKVNGRYLVTLPEKVVTCIELNFSPKERKIYDFYFKCSKKVVTELMNKGSLLDNYVHIFAAMLRLRQICCHKELLPVDWKNKDTVKELEDLISKEAQESHKGLDEGVARELAEQLRKFILEGLSDDCVICLSELDHPVITACAHIYCRQCITQYIETTPHPPAMCPLCRGPIKADQLMEAAHTEEEEQMEDFKDIEVIEQSSKVKALLKHLNQIRENNPKEKMIVVSQFTSLLSIIQPLLTSAGYHWTRLDGSMNSKKRTCVISHFQSEDSTSPSVLLLSLKAGGVGLNLSAANHLFLMDLAWNPSVEEQCFDRIHRLGQTKKVNIYKFIMKKSIEEQMLSIQAKKRDLISGAFVQDPSRFRSQRLQDIKDIFRL